MCEFEIQKKVFITHPNTYINVMRLNLRPGKRSLIAKVEDEAGVHNVVTLDPRNRCTYKLQFLCV